MKLQCRTRAGNGDPGQARCECCGCFLGRDGGQVQHRLARGSGGSSNPLVRSLANAALLCGTSVTPSCHGDAESRDPKRDMEAKGFVIRHGKGSRVRSALRAHRARQPVRVRDDGVAVGDRSRVPA